MKHLRAAEWFQIGVMTIAPVAFGVAAVADPAGRPKLIEALWWIVPAWVVFVLIVVWVRSDQVRAEQITRGRGDAPRPPPTP